MSGPTEFSNIDHAVLKGMVDGGKPADVLKRANQLQDAGRVLTDLSQALQGHLGNVSWEGPAAEGFKTWVGNLYKSAAIIAQHSTTAGNAMVQAGEALSTAQSAVPKPPQTEIDLLAKAKAQTLYMPSNVDLNGKSVDDFMFSLNPNWVSKDRAAQAAATIEKEKQEAILQMEKLAQAYTAATTTLNGIDDNVVLPGTPGKDSASKSDGSEYGGSATGSGGYRGYGGARGSRTSTGSYSPSAGYGVAAMKPRDPAAGWQDPSNPTHPSPTPPYGGGQLPPPPQDSGNPTPPSHPSDPVTRPGTGLDSIPTLPDQTTPVGPGGGPVLPSGPGGTPGYPGGPDGRGGLPGVPGGGPISGFPVGTGGGSVPTKGIGSIPGKGGGSVPLRTGPFSGGSVPGKTGTPGLPSGTVFGREGAPGGGRVGGSPMGGMHPGMGGGHGVVGGGGGSRGRGLTSTSGGTVGGRKGPAAGGEFTPGGTGLRNRAAAGAAEGGARSGQNGMMAPGAGGHGGKKERDRRDRADYLHEDEETWTSGTPHSNPDVIE